MIGIETIEKLKKFAGIFEAQHKTVFRCFRNTKAGGVQEVTVEILDAGPDADSDRRYSCVVTADNGKQASGNSGPSIDVVLATVHWYQLDQ